MLSKTSKPPLKRVLYISYDGMTDPLGQSQVLPYLKGLSKEYEIHLLSCEKPAAFEKTKGVIQNICDESNIHWHPMQYHKSPPVLSTVFDYLSLKKRAYSLHKKYNFTMTHCRSYIPAMVGLSLKQKKGVKFLFDMRGFWADERKESGSWNTSNPLFSKIYNYFKKKERSFFSQADSTISLTEAGKQAIENMNLPTTAPIQIIPCCADFGLFNFENYSFEQSKRKKDELGFHENDFVLNYLGSIGGSYMLEEMLEFFIEVKRIKKESKFLIITKSDTQPILNAIKALGIEDQDVKIISAERHELPLLISATDASIFFYKPTFSRKGTSPTKMAELMGLGIPVVANKSVGDVEEIISMSQSGIVVDLNNKRELDGAAKAILEIAKRPDRANIRKWGVDLFSLEDGIEKYFSVYNKILT